MRRLVVYVLLISLLCCVVTVSALELIVIMDRECITVDELYGFTICGCGGVTYVYPGLGDRVVILAHSCDYCQLVSVTVHELVHAVLDITDEYRTEYLTYYIMTYHLGEEARRCAIESALRIYAAWVREVAQMLESCVRSCSVYNNYFYLWCDCVATCIDRAVDMSVLWCGDYCRAAIDFLLDWLSNREPEWLQEVKWKLDIYTDLIRHYLGLVLRQWKNVN